MLIKTVIGKDLSKYSLPVFLNEPTTILQKCAEGMMFADYLIDAAEEPDVCKRMALVATFIAATQWVALNRTSKPFISLLGETYELITDKFKFVGECVRTAPCTLAFKTKGEKFELYKTCLTKMEFTGTQVNVQDSYEVNINLTLQDGSTEKYVYNFPKMTVGNLMIGTRYIEPSGRVHIENKTAKIECDLDFSERSWTSDYYTNRLEAVIRDKDYNDRITLQGYYSTYIEAKDLKDNSTWIAFRAPPPLDKAEDNFYMNAVAMQLNMMSDAMRESLPPTDSRLRRDMQLWEEDRLDEAENEKVRIEGI